MKGDMLKGIFLPTQAKKALKEQSPQNYEQSKLTMLRLKEMLSKKGISYLDQRAILNALSTQKEFPLVLSSSLDVSVDFLDTIEKLNPNVRFFLSHGLDALCRYEQELLSAKNKELGIHDSGKKLLPYYCTYSIKEMKGLLSKFAEVESWINPNWSESQKFVFLYDYVRSHIVTANNPNTMDKQTDSKGRSVGFMYNRSLRSLLYGRGVCLGQAISLSELLTRQGIVSFVDISKNHAWVDVKIDGKFYNVSVTNDDAWVGQTPEEFARSPLYKPLYTPKFNGQEIDFSTMNKHEFLKNRLIVCCPEDFSKQMFCVFLRSGKKVQVAPIGSVSIYGTKFYRYAYQEMPIGKNDLKVVYSCTDFSRFYQPSDKEKLKLWQDGLEWVFSKSSVDDALENNHGDVGYFWSDDDIALDYVSIDDALSSRIVNIYHNYTTPSGEKWVAVQREQLNLSVEKGSCIVYSYNLFKIDFENKTCVGYKIKTDRSLKNYVTDAEKNAVINLLFSDINIKDSVKNNMGYVGSVVNKGGKLCVEKNPEIEHRFKLDDLQCEKQIQTK